MIGSSREALPHVHQNDCSIDPRQLLIDNSIGRQPRCTARICPDCGTIARAYHSTHRWTYYAFACGAPSYKASRLRSRIEQLRSMPRQTAREGCRSNPRSRSRQTLDARQKSIQSLARSATKKPKHRIAPYATQTTQRRTDRRSRR